MTYSAGTGNDVDTVIKLFTPDHTLIAENDNEDASTTYSFIEFVCTTSGTYLIEVIIHNDPPLGDYVVVIRAPFPESQVGAIGTAEEVDNFSFFGEEGNIYEIYTSSVIGGTDADTFLELFGPDDLLVAAHDDIDDEDDEDGVNWYSWIQLYCDVSGVYVIAVSGTPPDSDYTLTIHVVSELVIE